MKTFRRLFYFFVLLCFLWCGVSIGVFLYWLFFEAKIM